MLRNSAWDKAVRMVFGGLTVPEVIAVPGVAELLLEHYHNTIYETAVTIQELEDDEAFMDRLDMEYD